MCIFFHQCESVYNFLCKTQTTTTYKAWIRYKTSKYKAKPSSTFKNTKDVIVVSRKKADVSYLQMLPEEQQLLQFHSGPMGSAVFGMMSICISKKINFQFTEILGSEMDSCIYSHLKKEPPKNLLVFLLIKRSSESGVVS